jgi:hypothetical protein
VPHIFVYFVIYALTILYTGLLFEDVNIVNSVKRQ